MGATRVFATDRSDLCDDDDEGGGGDEGGVAGLLQMSARARVAETGLRASGVDARCATYSSLDWDEHGIRHQGGGGGGVRGGGGGRDNCGESTWQRVYGLALPSEPCDVVMGSDVFYSSENFDDIFTIIASVFVSNPSAIFITTYKDRSSKRSLIPYLDVYGMTADYIPLESFLNAAHLSVGDSYCCSIVGTIGSGSGSGCTNYTAVNDSKDFSGKMNSTGPNNSISRDDSTIRNELGLQHFNGVYCLIIKLLIDT